MYVELVHAQWLILEDPGEFLAKTPLELGLKVESAKLSETLQCFSSFSGTDEGTWREIGRTKLPHCCMPENYYMKQLAHQVS